MNLNRLGQDELEGSNDMKNISAIQTKVGSEQFTGWLVGIGCGIVLTLSLALGTGRVVWHQPHAMPPAVVVQPPAVTGEGAVPPSLDEYQQYHRYQPAVLNSAALVPPINELQQYRQAERALQSGSGLVPPPIDEIKQLRHIESPDEIGAGAPAPLMPGSTKY
jgi:hypothetical protein